MINKPRFKTSSTLIVAFAAALITLNTSAEQAPRTSSTLEKNAARTVIKADIWADNWYALYRGEQLIKEDTVAFKTERSFNADSFTFQTELPATLSVIIKDFYEDDTGLEYIGKLRQQMGDGGFRAQFFDTKTQSLIAASNETWRCKVIHRAPINPECSKDNDPSATCKSEIQGEPSDWKIKDFDDSSWPNALIHSAQNIRPHGGYRDITWQPESQLIWSKDIEVDNILLCRFTIHEL
jgi:hypothetical protein